MKHFLLVYDTHAQQLRDLRRYSEADEAQAIREYEELEARHRDDRRIEVVLVSSDSLKTVRRTHGHYFGGRGRGRVARYLHRIA